MAGQTIKAAGVRAMQCLPINTTAAARGYQEKGSRLSREKSLFLVNRRYQSMRVLFWMILAIPVVGLCATQVAEARTHRRAPVSTSKPDAQIPVEMKRDPADIALDRKIKGICRGC
jgi:hypothetical protein